MSKYKHYHESVVRKSMNSRLDENINTSINATTALNMATKYEYASHSGQDSESEQSTSSTETRTSYIDPSPNDLTMWPGAALIVADCMGTGVLALPNDMRILGAFGFFFLVINLPINYYAGDILHKAASSVERRLMLTDGIVNGNELHADLDGGSLNNGNDGTMGEEMQAVNDGDISDWKYNADDSGDDMSDSDIANETSGTSGSATRNNLNQNDDNHHTNSTSKSQNNGNFQHEHHHYGIDSPHTSDFIGITYALFDHFETSTSASISKATIFVTAIYYTNIFLVLGNYILVMSHAVAAMIGEENICLPIAGIIASTLMFAISQLRTMAMLGRSASIISLVSLAIVVTQCLVAINSGSESFSYNDDHDRNLDADVQQQGSNGDYYNKFNENSGISFWQSMVSQLAALSSIGFAVGSQKLLLNIRHEFKDRNEAPKSLGIALIGFGTIYVLVCVLAGSNPPSFLFDAIASGMPRRISGFLLWVHVAVSFAINSQALCSSLDRLKFHRINVFSLGKKHRARWGVLTFLVGISSYFVAESIPFFKDLVSLIGALTSVPLTLLLPALYHRKVMNVPLFWTGDSLGLQSRTWGDILSLLLVIFSLIFLTCGMFGSISSIEMDWANHGPPFACH